MLNLGEPDWEGMARNREQPTGRPVMLQTWHDLIFIHARVPVDILQQMVPPELTVEQFDGSGWVGVVPFRMSGIRPLIGPPMPVLSSFYETNVRTYVTHPNNGPGVWFFSLEAAQFLACWYARQIFKLPYFYATMSGDIDKEMWRYQGRRNQKQRLPPVAGTTADLENYEISTHIKGPWHHAEEESFEWWLLERYRLYSSGVGERLITARVFHVPYTVAEANLTQVLIEGLEPQFGKLDFTSVLVAKTINVECFSPQKV